MTPLFHSAHSVRPLDLKLGELHGVDDLIRTKARLSAHGADILLLKDQPHPEYLVGYAVSPRGIEQAQRLRYEVFNKELGEGLDESHLTGLDQDAFDEQMDHLVVLKRDTLETVGTYRLQTSAMALAGIGFYAAAEYHLGALEPWFPTTIECGRASIIKEHRHIATLFMLWRGISLYLKLKGHRHTIGCCSLTSQNIDEGWRAKKRLRMDGVLSNEVWLNSTDDYACGDPAREFDDDLGRPLKIPRLFSAYIKLGAKVVSEPAIDRYFKTIDFLILLDASHIIRPETIELHRFKLILANRLAPGE